MAERNPEYKQQRQAAIDRARTISSENKSGCDSIVAVVWNSTLGQHRAALTNRENDNNGTLTFKSIGGGDEVEAVFVDGQERRAYNVNGYNVIRFDK